MCRREAEAQENTENQRRKQNAFKLICIIQRFPEMIQSKHYAKIDETVQKTI